MPTTEHTPFTVTTLNTHYAEAVMNPEVCLDLQQSDIALLQEVINIDTARLAQNIGSVGLRLAAFSEDTGLAIAISDRFKPIRSRQYCIQPRSRYARIASLGGFGHHFRARGVLASLLLDTTTNTQLTAITAHPTVALRHFSRKSQINDMSKVLQHYATGPLVLGADMNHYPAPLQVDKQMAKINRLRQVDAQEPTCLLTNTKHRWLQWLGLPDAQLDALLYRQLQEHASSVLPAYSDHHKVQAEFSFI